MAPSGTTFASWSVMTMKLGIVSATVVREVPLALQVDLAPLPVGDVDPARDDPDDVAALVDERRRAPGDHALLALGVREGVLVLGGLESGAASRKRWIIASRSSGSMKTSQK